MPDNEQLIIEPKHEAAKPEVARLEGVEPEVLAGTEYDTPPPQWVAGTVVPRDTDPADMTDAEYVQWCFENRMPYWAIKKEIYLRVPPEVTGVEPNTAAIGDPSFDIHVSGNGFIPDSVIVFAGQDEPTRLNEDGTLSTGVNMGVWHGPDTLEVKVRNGKLYSEPVTFTFTGEAAPEATDANDEADEDEQEYDQEPGDDTAKKKPRKARHKK
jgi:hypothetical protein